jgi:hypothetical protein
MSVWGRRELRPDASAGTIPGRLTAISLGA